MKFSIIFLVYFCLGCSSNRNKEVNGNSSILEITFQNYFNKDTVSLKINDCVVVKRETITSNEILGITGLKINLIDKEKIQLRTENIILPCKIDIDDKFTLEVTLNKKVSEKFKVDIKNGKYIGFNKVEGKIAISQSMKPFEYD